MAWEQGSMLTSVHTLSNELREELIHRGSGKSDGIKCKLFIDQ